MVSESHRIGQKAEVRDGDHGINPHERFKERFARPNADIPRRARSIDLDW